MKFGVLQFFSWPGRQVPLETVYERAFQRMEVMDKTGYDAVWLAEHHFSPLLPMRSSAMLTYCWSRNCAVIFPLFVWSLKAQALMIRSEMFGCYTVLGECMNVVKSTSKQIAM